jgi:choice-of-anchor B domain-containing protein
MTRFIRRYTNRLLVSGFLLTVLVVVPSAIEGPRAHDELPAHHKILPENATAVMRAFQEDLQAPQALAAATNVLCSGGFADIYPCDNVDLEAFMPLADIGGTRSNSAANDIWGWTDPQTGTEYAIIGRVFGTSFVEISDPANPVYLGELVTHGAFGSSWRDIKVYADHAFIVSEARNHGMQVFDLTQLRNVTFPPVTFTETAHYDGIGRAHNIAINEDTGYAYIVGASGKGSCSGGLHMVDISTPTAPTSAGCFSNDGYTHDTQCVVYQGPDTTYQGREICFNANEDTLTIVDVTDKGAPVQLSRTGYSGVAYTHQGWLTPNHDYFVQNDELDETDFGHNTRTRIWDVSDLTNLPAPTEFNGPTSAIDHNLYTKGDFAYEANYQAGLSVLDINDPLNASEVAFFDTYPDGNAPNFNGAWSNYPYFDSGIVIVSGIEQGLFVLRPNLGPVNNPPSVEITNPADGSTVIGSVPVDISASDEDAVGTLTVEWNIDGGAWQSTTYNSTTLLYESVTDWDSTSVADGSHTINARAIDSAANTSTSSNGVMVDNVPSADVHIGDLDGGSLPGGQGGKWNATVTVTVHDAGEVAVASATVSGSWSNGANGSDSCVTDGSGRCSITKNNVNRNRTSVTFTVDDVASGTDTYDAGANHDPDGDSNGSAIVVAAP